MKKSINNNNSASNNQSLAQQTSKELENIQKALINAGHTIDGSFEIIPSEIPFQCTNDANTLTHDNQNDIDALIEDIKELYYTVLLAINNTEIEYAKEILSAIEPHLKNFNQQLNSALINKDIHEDKLTEYLAIYKDFNQEQKDIKDKLFQKQIQPKTKKQIKREKIAAEKLKKTQQRLKANQKNFIRLKKATDTQTQPPSVTTTKNLPSKTYTVNISSKHGMHIYSTHSKDSNHENSKYIQYQSLFNRLKLQLLALAGTEQDIVKFLNNETTSFKEHPSLIDELTIEIYRLLLISTQNINNTASHSPQEKIDRNIINIKQCKIILHLLDINADKNNLDLRIKTLNKLVELLQNRVDFEVKFKTEAPSQTQQEPPAQYCSFLDVLKESEKDLAQYLETTMFSDEEEKSATEDKVDKDEKDLTIKKLNDQIEQLTIHNSKLTQKINNQKSEINRLMANEQENNEALKIEKSINSKINQSSQEILQKNKALELKLETLNQNYTRKEEKLKAQLRTLQSEKDKFKNSSKKLQEQSTKLKELNTEKLALTNNITKLKEEIKALNQKINDAATLEKIIESQAERLNTQSEQLHFEKNTNATLKSELEKYEQQAAELKKNLELLDAAEAIRQNLSEIKFSTQPIQKQNEQQKIFATLNAQIKKYTVKTQPQNAANNDVILPIKPEIYQQLKSLEKNGHYAFLAGGAVRDLWSDKCPKDYDIITTNPDLGEILGAYSLSIRPEIYRKRGSNNDYILATNLDLEKDAARRDATINTLHAIAGDKANTIKIIDCLGVLNDLSHNMLTMYNNKNGERFEQDPSRILRFLRQGFELKLHHNIHDLAWIFRHRQLLSKVPLGIILTNLKQQFQPGFAVNMLNKILELDLYYHLFPITQQKDATPELEHMVISFWQTIMHNLDQRNPMFDLNRRYVAHGLFFLLPYQVLLERYQGDNAKTHQVLFDSFFRHYPMPDINDKYAFQRAVTKILEMVSVQYKAYCAWHHEQHANIQNHFTPLLNGSLTPSPTSSYSSHSPSPTAITPGFKLNSKKPRAASLGLKPSRQPNQAYVDTHCRLGPGRP